MSGGKRLLMAMSLSDELREFTLAGFRKRHLQIPEKEFWTLFFKEIHHVEIKQE